MSISRREPLEFTAGDTLYFRRDFPEFLPSLGWSLSYEIRSGQGGDAIQFVATADATNSFFIIAVTPNVTALWQPGACRLVGFVTNTLQGSPRLGERHNIYNNEIVVLPNLGSNTDDAVITTHAQRMIQYLEGQLEQLAQHALQDSSVEQTELRRVKRLDLLEQLKQYREIRANEVAIENVRNGKPSGRKILPIMRIVSGQPGIGNLYGFPPY